MLTMVELSILLRLLSGDNVEFSGAVVEILAGIVVLTLTIGSVTLTGRETFIGAGEIGATDWKVGYGLGADVTLVLFMGLPTGAVVGAADG